LIKKERPEKSREVGVVITAYTLILIALSFIWVDLSPTKTFPILQSQRQKAVNKLVDEINGPLIRRERWSKFNDLARFGDLAVDPMIRFLSSENPENQEFAAALLDDLGDTNAIKPLQKLIDHPWENVRVNVLNSLTNLDDPSIDSILLHRIDYEEGAYPRIVIFECLGRKKVEGGLSILIDATTEDNSRIRLAAVKSLSEIDPVAAIPFIFPLLSDESAWVRGTAATLAHKLKAKETLPYLKPLLEDENYEVRFFAKQAIREIEE
jgi:HEAT repeat protein